MNTTAKTDNFLKAIKRHAKSRKTAMQKEVNQLKGEKIKSAELKAKRDSEKLIKDKLEEKRNEQTALLAKKTQEGQRELFVERAEMTKEVFRLAENKLKRYAESGEYKTKLLQSARQIAELFENEPCVVYIKSGDEGLSDEIKAVFNGTAQVTAAKDIVIGGIRGYCKTKSIIADETLDSKLAEQRNWFIENAELKVI